MSSNQPAIPYSPYSGDSLYGEGELKRLRFVRHAKELGFTLKEIKELMELRVESPSAGHKDCVISSSTAGRISPVLIFLGLLFSTLPVRDVQGAGEELNKIVLVGRVDFLNSTTALDLKRLPASMIILGGRFVAVEMAQIFAHFGAKVIILQRSNRIIPEEEEEISIALKNYLKDEGIEVYTGTKVLEVFAEEGQRAVKTEIEGHVPKARAIRDTRGLIKMVAEEETERVVGIHILAPEAAEIIHQAALIIRNAMTVKDVIDKIDVYPTLSEMAKLCAQSFYEDIEGLSCCAE